MARSPDRMRLALLSGAAFLPLVLAGQAQAQTICTQAADGAVTCTEGAEVVATGTMTPGTVTTGPGLVVPLTPDPVEGTITGSISTDGPGETAVSLNSDFFVNYVQDGNILATGAGAGGIRVFSFVATSVSAMTTDVPWFEKAAEAGAIAPISTATVSPMRVRTRREVLTLGLLSPGRRVGRCWVRRW